MKYTVWTDVKSGDIVKIVSKKKANQLLDNSTALKNKYDSNCNPEAAYAIINRKKQNIDKVLYVCGEWIHLASGDVVHYRFINKKKACVCKCKCEKCNGWRL